MQLRQGHLVVHLVRIAPIDACKRRLRQRRLDAHHCIRVRLCPRLRLANHAHQLYDVGRVLLAQRYALHVRLQVVIAIR